MDITEKVRINSATELELMEDARKGDRIDLTRLVQVNLIPLQEAIDRNKDQVYKERIASEKEKWEANSKAELSNQAVVLKDESGKSEKKLNDRIQELSQENAILKEQRKSRKEGEDDRRNIAVRNKEDERKKEFDGQLSIKDKDREALRAQFQELKQELEVCKTLEGSHIQEAVSKKENERKIQIKEREGRLDRSKREKEAEILKQKQRDNEAFQKLNDQYQALRLEKSSHNVKRLGEGLEKWCNDEYQHYALSGFKDCLWLKDNAAVREDGTRGAGGTKADYIFGIFSDAKACNEVLRLSDAKKNPSMEKARTSVIRDRKNEDPDSSNKKTNASYFAKLDRDRKKKNCEYALLVSELERDNPNYGFITKAQGYEKRYVVRPPYLRTFLSRLYSLTEHYRLILNQKGVEEERLKKKQELFDEFDALKETYFEKPLAQMEKDREGILKNCMQIEKNNNEIKSLASDILQSKIANRRTKIETFELKKRKTLANKADKIED